MIGRSLACGSTTVKKWGNSTGEGRALVFRRRGSTLALPPRLGVIATKMNIGLDRWPDGWGGLVIVYDYTSDLDVHWDPAPGILTVENGAPRC